MTPTPKTPLSLCPFFSPPRGQDQVHDFERPHVENLKIFRRVSMQQNILESRRQSLHSRTQGCASGIGARVSVLSPCSVVCRDGSAQLAAHLREMKCK